MTPFRYCSRRCGTVQGNVYGTAYGSPRTHRKDTEMKNKTLCSLTAASLTLAMLAAPAAMTVGAEDTNSLYTIEYYRDAEKTQAVALSDIAAGEEVYYTLEPSKNCFITSLSTNGSYTDDEKMIFDTADREIKVDAYLAGDINADGKLDTRDLVRAMRYIAGGFEVGTIDNDCLMAFDTNFDALITVKDLIRAMKLLSGAELDLSGAYPYRGAEREYTETVMYSAVRPTETVNFGYVDIITSVDELNTYLEAAALLYDFDSELNYASESDAERYKDRLMDVAAVKAKYDSAYFESKMLIVATLLSIDEATDPVITSVTKGAELGTPCVNVEYRWERAGDEPVGAIGCYAHHYIETEKMSMSPTQDGDTTSYAAWIYAKGLQEFGN